MRKILENKVFYERTFFAEKWYKILNINVDNQNFKTFYNNLLKKIYNPLGLWRNETNEYFKGVYNTGYRNDPSRSNLNFIDTNYTSFKYLIDKINDYIIKGKYINYTQINFHNEDLEIEMRKLFDILNEYKSDIFNNNSEILLNIIDIINKTKYYGELAENYTIKKLSEFDGIQNIVKSKDWGYKPDMFGGIDIKFTYNNITYTIQVKSFKRVEIDNNFFTLKEVSNPKHYNVDFIAFYNRNNDDFYMFKNKNIIIVENSMIIPKIYKKNI